MSSLLYSSICSLGVSRHLLRLLNYNLEAEIDKLWLVRGYHELWRSRDRLEEHYYKHERFPLSINEGRAAYIEYKQSIRMCTL